MADRPRLTGRQLEILTWIAQGRSMPQIAAEMHLSVDTVRNHRRSLYARLGAHSAAEAVALAFRQGVLR